MINSHVRDAAFAPRDRAEDEGEGEGGGGGEIPPRCITRDYSRLYPMEIGITYLRPHDDDGNSTILSPSPSLSLSLSLSLSFPRERRQGARVLRSRIRAGLLHMTNRRLLPFNLFARPHLHTIVSPVVLYIRPRPSVDILNTRDFFSARVTDERRERRVARARGVDKATIDRSLARLLREKTTPWHSERHV